MYKNFNKENDPNMIGLSDKLMSMLDNARTIADIPFIITSGLRTPEHNKEVGGVEDSAHIKGLGADIQCTDSSNRYLMVYSLFVAGFKRIEITKGHIHVDIDDSKDQKVIFLK
jgi:uncharacterized protein YcbK (DUF882 family)